MSDYRGSESVLGPQNRDELQSWLDHQVKGEFSSAIGLAKLALGEAGGSPHPSKAMEYLKQACDKADELNTLAQERYEQLDPEKQRLEFYSVRVDDSHNTFLMAAPSLLAAVKKTIAYSRPRRLVVEWLIDGNEPDLNERMGKVES